jgi:UDPglucose 6-dehydrogenase
VKALIWIAREYGMDVPLFEAVESINMRQKCIIFNRLKKYFHNKLRDKVVALWGLAFKPNTDDMREAPSRVLMELLWHEGAMVRAYDPVAANEARRIYGEQPRLVLCEDISATLDGADVLVIVTEWDEFKKPDFNLLKEKLKHKVIFDGRNLYDPTELAKWDIEYYSIGRGAFNGCEKE